MPSTFEIVVIAVYGLLIALIIVFSVVHCFAKCFRPSQDIESGEAGNPIGVQAMQRRPSQKQQTEASRPILVLYKNAQETESKCTDCAICLEEFRDGNRCRILSNCKHLYHEVCINQWLVKDWHCPLCRSSIRL